MLSLDQVRDEILELMNSCGADPEKAQAGIQEVFYSLMCADQPFYPCACLATANLRKSIPDARIRPIRNIPCWTSSR